MKNLLEKKRRSEEAKLFYLQNKESSWIPEDEIEERILKSRKAICVICSILNEKFSAEEFPEHTQEDKNYIKKLFLNQ